MSDIEQPAMTAAPSLFGRVRTRARAVSAVAVVVAALACLPASAQAGFGLSEFDVSFSDADGAAVTQAGSHPYEMTTKLALNTEESGGKILPVESTRNLLVTLAPGFAGDQSATLRCPTLDFLVVQPPIKIGDYGTPSCADSTAVGTVTVEVGSVAGIVAIPAPLYNLEPPPGKVARLGFIVEAVPITIDIALSETRPYNLVAITSKIAQALEFYGAELKIWGTPGDPAHDEERGRCFQGGLACPANTSERPFLTLPRSCTGPLETRYEVDSWQKPGLFLKGSALSHDEALPPNPVGMSGCGKLGFSPSITAKPTSRAAESSSGLDFSLDTTNEGLANPEGISNADISKAVITLPEGVTANPSSASGLEVCSEAQLAAETPYAAPGEGPTFTPPGAGCPEASKLGTIEVETPILEGKLLKGSLFLAKPYENPFGTLLALYVVIRDPGLGLILKLPLKVEPDPNTGQLVTTSEDIPPYPFSHFRLHFREGARSPLVTPPACGSYDVKALLYPSTGGAPAPSTSSFQIISGPGEGPCPKAGTPPFDPGFQAGAINNNAGSYSRFDMRLTRKDGDQDLTKFSAKLPPGMIGKLAGTTQCSAAQIAQARSRTGPNGAQEELEHPSCPASSQVGHALAGAGVGPTPIYVPGSIYLAGPYKGAPLSVVAIVPALAGPFDAGTVVTQEALRIDPLTAEVEADGSSSDPIPHILKGIPLKVRDIRVYVDKPNFTLNPTSCEPSSTKATLWGGGSNVFSSLDDSPLSLAARFQAANCANLAFKPRLSLKLKGGTKRGAHPALIGTYAPRETDANLKSLVLRLPRSAFLEQGHIRTICTRVQFAANGGNGAGCPAAAIYGKAIAYTPILEAPLEGPVYLRSSNHNLPDFVAALHGLVDVEAVARIDSKHGGIRASFESVPDAPLSKVIVQMQGQKKGLIVNSTDLCKGTHKSNADYTGHNGKRFSAKPVLRADCGGKRKHKRHRG